jgi:EpsI family protein
VSRQQIILSVFLITQAVGIYFLPKTEIAINTTPLELLPTQVDSWQMVAEYPMEPEIQAQLQTDDSINRIYSGPGGNVNLFIAYFLTQRTGKKPHSPKNCFPGQGWEPIRSDIVTIPLTDNRAIEVNHYVLQKGSQKSIVFYWYQSNERVIASELDARIYTVLDSIKKRRSDTALVRVMVNLPQSGNERDAYRVLTDFVHSMFPKIKDHLPA